MKIKRSFRSRTVRVAAALAVLSAVQVALPSVQATLPAEAYGWIGMAVAVIMALLRVLTTKPLEDR